MSIFRRSAPHICVLVMVFLLDSKDATGSNFSRSSGWSVTEFGSPNSGRQPHGSRLQGALAFLGHLAIGGSKPAGVFVLQI